MDFVDDDDAPTIIQFDRRAAVRDRATGLASKAHSRASPSPAAAPFERSARVDPPKKDQCWGLHNRGGNQPRADAGLLCLLDDRALLLGADAAPVARPSAASDVKRYLRRAQLAVLLNCAQLG